VQSPATFSPYRLFVRIVCIFVFLLCRNTRRLTDEIVFFSVILHLDRFYVFIPENSRILVHHKKYTLSTKEYGLYERYEPSLFGVSLYSLWDPYLYGWVSGEKSWRKPWLELSSVQEGLISLENIFST